MVHKVCQKSEMDIMSFFGNPFSQSNAWIVVSDVYIDLIIVCQQILADPAKNKHEKHMGQHCMYCIGQNHCRCTDPNIKMTVIVSQPRFPE